MKKRRSPHLLAAFGVLLGVCGVFVLKRSPNATITLGGTEPRAETGSLMQQGTGLGSADTSDGKVKETMGGHRDKAAPSTEPVLASKTDDSAKKAALSPSEQSRTLSHYSMIKEKVFLSDEEKAWKRQLLKNQSFLLDLKEVLLQPVVAASVEWSQQKAALDLLFDALAAGEQTVAQTVLREVVEDPSIEEGSNLTQEARVNLAGVKAEVLFHWSAVDPIKATEIASWLPGPVSSKIWENVVAEQQNNLAESSLEARSRAF